MTIDPRAIKRFLDAVPPELPRFKGRTPLDLERIIYDCTGSHYQEKNKSRPHQLEGTAFALYKRRSLLFYWMRLGKALRQDWPVATPQGWRAIGELRPGDYVIGRDGRATKVHAVYPQGMRPMYRVTFTDGATTVCDPEHVWVVNHPRRIHLGLAPQEKTLSQILYEGLRDPVSRTYKHGIPLTQPVEYPKRYLPIDPYTMGAFLGDGCSAGANLNITTDAEIISRLVLPAGVHMRVVAQESPGIATGYFLGCNRSNPFRNALQAFGLMDHRADVKFIPDTYMTASIQQRRALLAGLLDTDGWVQGTSNTQWGSTGLQLANQMQTLVRSLGGTAKLNKRKTSHEYKGEKRSGKDYHSISIRLPLEFGCPFRLKRKAERWVPLTKYQPRRAIATIERIEDAQAVCIKVAADDGLFVIRDYVVTHNTKIGLDWSAHLKRSGLARGGKGLIIAHGPAGVDVWERQTHLHSDLVPRLIRSGPDARDEFVDALEDDSDLVVIAWSMLQSLFTETRINRKGVPKEYADLTAIRLAAPYFNHCIIDETHFVSNSNTLRFHIGAELLLNCKQRLGLTGTPVGRNAFSVWSQAYLIDEGRTLGTNYYFFEAAFGTKKKSHFSKKGEVTVFDKAKLPILHEKLASISLTYGKGEVKSAEVFNNQVDLTMLPIQRRAYNALADEIATASMNDTRIHGIFHRMRMIASGYDTFDDGSDSPKRIVHFGSIKLNWLTELMEEMPPEAQAVIFHEYIHSGELICKMLQKLKISHAWVYGKTTNPGKEIAKFQSGEVRILVGNTRTIGTAVDLPQADYLCFFESPSSPIVRAQAQERPMARALDRPLFLDDLVCAPIEQRILNMLAEGKDLLNSLTRGGRKLADSLRA